MATAPVAPNRFWTSPDGRLWRVWLEPPARHRIRQGNLSPILTFVSMDDTQDAKRPLALPEGTRLKEASDAMLEEWFRAASASS